MRIFILLLLIACHADAAQKKFSIAINPFPPWIILQEGKPPFGIDINASELIVEKLNYQPVYIQCPLQRCLQLMKNGDVDSMVNLFFSDERNEYAAFVEHNLFIDPPKQFYFLIDKQIEDINSIDDLSAYTIGKVRGALYFSEFDQAENLTTIDAVNVETLVAMLLKNRFEVLIGSEATVDYFVTKMNAQFKVQKATFKYKSNRNSYFAISRKSPFMNEFNKISDAIKILKESGAFEQSYNDFWLDNSL